MARYHYKKYKGISLLARDLRKNQTSSEKLLWKILRRKNILGYRFLRQHPIFYRINREEVEFFIADFYCAKINLVIEVDGKIHEYQKEYDSERDLKLLNKGIHVVRIKNEEIPNENLALEVINQILSRYISKIVDNKQINPPSLIV